MDCKKPLGFKDGAAAAFPVVIGYFPAAMAFGLLAKSINVSLLDSFMFSVFVFAGASQFMALNLIAAGTAFGEIILATLLLNFRHFLMSASLAARLEGKGKKLLSLVAFGVTDETFSVASVREEKPTVPFLITLEGLSYSSWVTGTVVGYMAGSILPATVQSSMGIALYAMFVAILVPEFKKSVFIAALAIGSGIINALLNYMGWLPSGWNMIISTVLVSFVGTLVYENKSEEVAA